MIIYIYSLSSERRFLHHLLDYPSCRAIENKKNEIINNTRKESLIKMHFFIIRVICYKIAYLASLGCVSNCFTIVLIDMV